MEHQRPISLEYGCLAECEIRIADAQLAGV
jgi:hypothetical protein